MESPDLTPLSPEDDTVSAFLKTQMPALRDDGFTVRVLSALPPRRRTRSLHVWLAGMGALAGFLFAATRGALTPELPAGDAAVFNLFNSIAAALGDPWLTLALAVTVLSLLIPYAVSRYCGGGRRHAWR